MCHQDVILLFISSAFFQIYHSDSLWCTLEWGFFPFRLSSHFSSSCVWYRKYLVAGSPAHLYCCHWWLESHVFPVSCAHCFQLLKKNGFDTKVLWAYSLSTVKGMVFENYFFVWMGWQNEGWSHVNTFQCCIMLVTM